MGTKTHLRGYLKKICWKFFINISPLNILPTVKLSQIYNPNCQAVLVTVKMNEQNMSENPTLPGFGSNGPHYK